MAENYTLSDQLADHQAMRDQADLCKLVERETIDAAVQACIDVVFEIGAEPGSSIHSALKTAADRIRNIAPSGEQ